MKTILETPRLSLREMSMDDLDFVAGMLAHPEVMQFWPKCYHRDEAVEWIERQQERYDQDGVGYWLAIDKASHHPIGQAGLLVQDVDEVKEIGLGYIIHRPFWRQGYALEAASACRSHAFDVLARRRVIALIRPENTPSRALAVRLGMTVATRTQFAGFEHLVYVTSG